MTIHRTELGEKLRESVKSILPIALIVAALCFTIAPMATDLLLSFAVGSAMLILGLGLFMFGAENSMTVIGNLIGARLTKSRKLPLILVVSFLLGVIITLAEPDLNVLADNVPHINTMVLILTVSLGVGFFLLLCMLRILLGWQLKWLLLFFYAVIFVLAFFSDRDYLSIAFDAGGVTTGPMTAPFIIALGVGVASIRSDRNAEADSFGLVGLSSVGPILAVLILSFFYKAESGEIAASAVRSYADTVELGYSYLRHIPHEMKEAAIAFLPILLFFLVFQVWMLHLKKIPLIKILVGLAYTYIGLVIFLTGVNVGFSSLGVILGRELASGWTRFLIFPLVAVMGWFIVMAEPAVHVLTKQVEEISAGAVSEHSMLMSLSAAIALAMMLAMVRCFTGIPILYFVLPGYAIALLLSFFVPPVFTAIAFDSGGVASGPMSATFMLPFAMGVCEATGGNLLTDAFGIVALVAMTPLITVQVMGVISVLKEKKGETRVATGFGDAEVIELW